MLKTQHQRLWKTTLEEEILPSNANWNPTRIMLGVLAVIVKTNPFAMACIKRRMPLPPMIFSIEEEKTAHLCTCKLTKNPPYCDGSHK